MIATLALAATVAKAPIVVPDQTSNLVVVQAHVARPPMRDGRLLGAWYVIGDTLLKGAEGYSELTLMSYGSQAGIQPSVVTFPDHMRIEFVAPEGGLDLAMELMTAVLKRPRLRDRDVIDAIARFETQKPKPLAAAGYQYQGRYSRLSSPYVKNVYNRAFTPETVQFVFGGKVSKEEANQAMEDWVARWRPDPSTRIPMRESLAPITGVGGEVSVYALRGKPFRLDEPGAVPKLLATYALGVGKGASCFRVLRQKNAWSYQQGAYLWPSIEGFVPVVYMLQSSNRGDGALVAEMRAELLKDIESWDEATFARAVSVASSSEHLAQAPTAFLSSPSSGMGRTVRDRCALQGYLSLTGSGQARLETVLGAMQNVDLDQLQTAAKSMVEDASGTWIPGN